MDNKESYEFTNEWFGSVKPVWSNLIPIINPTRILEIGCYEGASTCFIIDTIAKNKAIEIHCIDTWEGGVEHKDNGTDMGNVEARFKKNLRLAIAKAVNDVGLTVHKGFSDVELPKLLVSGRQQYFDFIYVDGSHQAPDVIFDAILSFKLLKVGGVIVFDDYLWAESLSYGLDPMRCPKPAIDAFTNLFCRKIRIIQAPLYQLYIQKISN